MLEGNVGSRNVDMMRIVGDSCRMRICRDEVLIGVLSE